MNDYVKQLEQTIESLQADLDIYKEKSDLFDFIMKKVSVHNENLHYCDTYKVVIQFTEIKDLSLPQSDEYYLNKIKDYAKK